MSAFRIQNQCLFLAIYASCILLCASIMSSVQNGPDDAVGTTQSVRFVCTNLYNTYIFWVYTWYINRIYLEYSLKKKYTWYIPYIYLFEKVYIWYIPGIYLSYDHLVHIPGLYLVKTLWVCSVPVTYPNGHGIYQVYTWYRTNP